MLAAKPAFLTSSFAALASSCRLRLVASSRQPCCSFGVVCSALRSWSSRRRPSARSRLVSQSGVHMPDVLVNRRVALLAEAHLLVALRPGCRRGSACRTSGRPPGRPRARWCPAVSMMPPSGLLGRGPCLTCRLTMRSPSTRTRPASRSIASTLPRLLRRLLGALGARDHLHRVANLELLHGSLSLRLRPRGLPARAR